jgi:hypothetical protein
MASRGGRIDRDAHRFAGTVAMAFTLVVAFAASCLPRGVADRTP